MIPGVCVGVGVLSLYPHWKKSLAFTPPLKKIWAKNGKNF